MLINKSWHGTCVFPCEVWCIRAADVWSVSPLGVYHNALNLAGKNQSKPCWSKHIFSLLANAEKMYISKLLVFQHIINWCIQCFHSQKCQLFLIAKLSLAKFFTFINFSTNNFGGFWITMSEFRMDAHLFFILTTNQVLIILIL